MRTLEYLSKKHKIDLFLKTFHCYLHLQWLMFCYSIMFILNLYKEAVLFNVRKKYHHKNVPIRSSPSHMKYSTQLCCWKTKLNHTKGRFSALLHCTGFLEKIHYYVSLFWSLIWIFISFHSHEWGIRMDNMSLKFVSDKVTFLCSSEESRKGNPWLFLVCKLKT